MKMRKWINGLLVLLVLSIASCQKADIPSSDLGAVLFKFDGSIDGNVVFEAGENNYIMHTDYVDNGNSDVLLMRGEFRNKSNTDDDFLRFEFYGYDSVNNTNILQNVFNQTDFKSYSQDTLEQITGSNILKFYTLYGTSSNVDWDFGDGSIGTGDTAIHTYSSVLNDVTVTMTSYNALANCTDTVANFINLTDPINNQVQFGVIPTTTNLDSFEFTATVGFNTYTWDFGDLIPPQQLTINTAMTYYGDSSRKTIELTATKAGLVSYWKAVINPNRIAPCFAAYKYDVLSTPVKNVSQRVPYKSCIITYKKNGATYRSYKNNSSNQSNRNVFVLANASPYENNAEGKATLRLQGAVNTYLYNVNNANDSIRMNSNELTIAVAHP